MVCRRIILEAQRFPKHSLLCNVRLQIPLDSHCLPGVFHTHTHTHSHARCLAGRRQSQTITNLDLDKSILRHLPSEKEALLLFRKVCSDLSSSVIFQRQAPALGLKVAMLEGVLQTFLRHWSTSLGFLRRRDDAFLEYLMQAKRYISEWALSAA